MMENDFNDAEQAYQERPAHPLPTGWDAIPPKTQREDRSVDHAVNRREPRRADDGAMKQQEHAIDRAIGWAIRHHRISNGLSQGRLGQAIGLTFQQIQKYERGANRISASRLASIASVLGIAPADILNEALANAVPAAQQAKPDNSRGSLAFVCYYRHLDEKTQTSVRNLLASLAACD